MLWFPVVKMVAYRLKKQIWGEDKIVFGIKRYFDFWNYTHKNIYRKIKSLKHKHINTDFIHK